MLDAMRYLCDEVVELVDFKEALEDPKAILESLADAVGQAAMQEDATRVRVAGPADSGLGGLADNKLGASGQRIGSKEQRIVRRLSPNMAEYLPKNERVSASIAKQANPNYKGDPPYTGASYAHNFTAAR